MSSILRHTTLGAIKGKLIGGDLIRFFSLPYATAPSRFARSQRLTELSAQNGSDSYDATSIGPSSIQLQKAAHNDAESNQLPTDDVEEQEQDEDCLRLTVTIPQDAHDSSKLPVVVFIHGGAFFLGSGDRRWLDPTTFCRQGVKSKKPFVFVSVNYRLGLLGFLHAPKAATIMPANNALHDQLRAFEWIKHNVAGFGGDPDNITAMGQSAGGESLSLHNMSGINYPLYKRSVTLSGTLVTMPPKTPEEYRSTFLECAEKMNISVEGKTDEDIAGEMLEVDVDAIRSANFVGAPCTDTEVLPYQRPSMHLMRSESSLRVSWLESQIVSSCTYDGSISYIITHNAPKRDNHAASFFQLARKLLKNPQKLFDLYSMSENDQDDAALDKICLFESDVGFVSATISQAMGMTTSSTATYLQIFDLGNPFQGLLQQGRYASHTFDIVALLGAYEDRQDKDYRRIIQNWRQTIIEYAIDGAAPCNEFKKAREGLLIDKQGVRNVSEQELPGAARRAGLWKLAWSEKGEDGLDFLWEGVCRRWLDQGE